MELGLSHTRTATITISSAAVDDIIGWLLLGVVSTVVMSRFQPTDFLLKIAGVGAFIFVVIFIVRPFFKKWISHKLAQDGHLKETTVGWILLMLLVSAATTSNLGVFAIIGGLIVGIALHENREFVSEWKLRVSSLINVFFLPMFFTYTGLRTDIGSLENTQDWLVCILICLLAFVSKFGGTYFASRLIGENRRNSTAIGVAMNTRALMELIVLNIGYDLGVLPQQIFTMLVIMAVVSTFIATPLIRWLMSDQRKIPAPSQDQSKRLGEATEIIVDRASGEDRQARDCLI